MNKITYNADGSAQSFTGEAVSVFVMATLASGLRLYARTGMKPNRNWSPKNMMANAERWTGIKFKAREYEKAADALTALIQVGKARFSE